MVIPKQIDLEVTSACNLKCKYCPILSNYHKSKHMDPDFYKSVIDRIIKENFKTVIIPWLNGEPLLHPNYAELIKYTTKAKLPAYITTNGTIWDNELFEHITKDTSVYQIIFSLDGLWTTNSIEKARPGSDRKKIKENIYRFIKLKNKRKSKIDLALKICRRGQDYEEIEEYIKFWLSTKGVDFVIVGDALIDDKTEEFRIYPCQYSDNNFMVIKPDQRICFCAYNDEMTNNPDNAVGILDYDTPLLEFYNNEKYIEFRENQRNRIFSDICSHCGFAYTGQGITGTIKFRNNDNFPHLIYYHKDYYNQFFSLKKRLKPEKYYLQRGHIPAQYYEKKK